MHSKYRKSWLKKSETWKRIEKTKALPDPLCGSGSRQGGVIKPSMPSIILGTRATTTLKKRRRATMTMTLTMTITLGTMTLMISAPLGLATPMGLNLATAMTMVTIVHDQCSCWLLCFVVEKVLK